MTDDKLPRSRRNNGGSGKARSASLPLAVLGIVVLIPLATFMVGAWLSGLKLQPVLTSSMEPTYPRGSLLVLGAVTPDDVEVGTALEFEDPQNPGRVITHRVVEIVPQERGLFFRTQGDANATADGILIPAANVRGEVRWAVPALGRWIQWLAWPRGLLVISLPAALALTVTEAVAWRRRRVGRQNCEVCGSRAAKVAST